MQRDPKEKYITVRLNSIKVQKIIPIFKWITCEKCGIEYTREPIYKCTYKNLFFPDENDVHFGCTHCFSQENDFKTWLEGIGRLYTREFLTGNYENSFEAFEKHNRQVYGYR